MQNVECFFIILANVKVVAPPPLESEGVVIEELKGGCPPTSCSLSSFLSIISNAIH
jgi:hypothetical protein